MQLISTEIQETVGIIELKNGVTNTISQQMIQEMAESLEIFDADPQVRGLVITGSGDKFFSIGFDIPNLYDLSRAEFEDFYNTFNRFALRLFTFPKPTIAAITGHAIAGGCILALCCDYRFIAAGRKLMGLNEIKLGVPVPYTADCILRDLIGTQRGRDVLELGEFYPPDDLLHLGMVDKVAPLEEVLPAAIEHIKLIGKNPLEAYAITKANRTKPVETAIRADFQEKMDQFIDCWYAPEGRARIKEAMQKF
jgi:enoyl-CoA hydratase/carnithine racemase